MSVDSWGAGRDDYTQTVSGDHLFIESGAILNISGQPVDISGAMLASGMFVLISGQHVFVESGVFVVADVSVEVSSGLFVDGVSGTHVYPEYYGLDSQGNAVHVEMLRATTSGDLYIASGAYVVADVTVEVSSGLWVIADVLSGIEVIWRGIQVSGAVQVSGAIQVSGAVMISGQIYMTSGTVAILSGLVSILSGNIGVYSGAFVDGISGQWFTLSSGNQVIIASGQAVTMVSGVEVVWRGVQVSGAVIVSGTVSIVSGAQVITQPIGQISGTVIVASGVEVIWRGVQVSGTVSISGNVISLESPTVVRTASLKPVTADSGGEALIYDIVGCSGPINSVILKSLSGNNDIFIGGTACKPYSGFGYLLTAEEKVTIDINNALVVYACANTSGNRVSFIATD